MTKINTILVIVDPTAETHPAVEKAARLATAFGARLDLFACETKASLAARYAKHLQRGSNSDFVVDTRALLDRLAAPLRNAGLDVATDATSGDPLHAKLVERARSTSADLIVKDTHHHSLSKRTFITNTDWHLIRSCSVPLLLTKSKPWSQAPKLLAALDPLHVNDKPAVLDNRILDWSQALQRKLGGPLHLVHAYLPVVLIAEASSGVPPLLSAVTPQLLEDERQRALQSVLALAAKRGIDPEHVTAQLGVASDVIPQFAEDGAAEVVVMGAISRSGIQRLFVGSTAERVLERLPCDVLVIKSPDFVSALPF